MSKRVLMRKTVLIIATIGLAGVGFNYMSGVWLRSHAHDCERKQSSDGVYIAELCLLMDNGHDADYVARIYAARNGVLLAERTFDTTQADMEWFDGQVTFQHGGDADSWITLPPSMLDRLRAKLP